MTHDHTPNPIDYDELPVFAFEVERVLANGEYLTVSCYDMPRSFAPVMEALAIHMARDIDTRLRDCLLPDVCVQLCFSGFGAVVNVTDIKLYGAIAVRDVVEHAHYSSRDTLLHVERLLRHAAKQLAE